MMQLFIRIIVPDGRLPIAVYSAGELVAEFASEIDALRFIASVNRSAA